jgi:hypothetical protein
VTGIADLTGLPAMLTIEEASSVLRVSRRVGYQLAREYLDSGGERGLPVVRLGARVLRVPRVALDQLVSGGHVNGNAAHVDGAAQHEEPASRE